MATIAIADGRRIGVGAGAVHDKLAGRSACATKKTSGFGCCSFDDAVDEKQDDGAYY